MLCGGLVGAIWACKVFQQLRKIYVHCHCLPRDRLPQCCHVGADNAHVPKEMLASIEEVATIATLLTAVRRLRLGYTMMVINSDCD